MSSCSNVTTETRDNFDIVELPDGSVAFLNHNSALKYNKDFDSRNVTIEGEVFFDVVNGEIPFIVNTEHGEVKVLGTEFDVRSDKEEMEIEVEEGTVELKTKQQTSKIKRGERAVYKQNAKAIEKGKAEFKFKVWIKSLEVEFKKLGKEIKRGSKQVRKESEKAGKELKNEVKKLIK